MSVGTIIFILIAVISGVSSLLDNDKKKKVPGKKGGTSKGVLSELQKQIQQIETTMNQGMNRESTGNATTQARGQAVGQVKPKKVVQHRSNIKENTKQNVKAKAEQASLSRQSKTVVTQTVTLAEQIYKIENDQNLTPRQKQNRIQSLVMAQDIEVAVDDLTFDKAAVLNGIIMSEVLGKPKSLQ
ncbi:hypothetical protein MKY53_01080 [Macrococcus sp. FSL R5-0951]